MQLTRMTCLLASYGTILANGDGRTALPVHEGAVEQEPVLWRLCPGLAPVPQQGKAARGAGREGRAARHHRAQRRLGPGHLPRAPLDYYEGDTQPGDVGCQNVVEFGGLWLIVAPNGEAIRS